MGNNKSSTNILAGLCSFLFAGLGQVLTGRVFSGILWFFVVYIGYFCFVIPGWILHLLCIIDATRE